MDDKNKQFVEKHEIPTNLMWYASKKLRVVNVGTGVSQKKPKTCTLRNFKKHPRLVAPIATSAGNTVIRPQELDIEN